MRSASRCTGAFEPCASSTSRAICASAVSLPDPASPRRRVGRDVLSVAPNTASPVVDVDRHRLAGEHRHVDRRRAVDHDAVGRDLLARSHDEAVTDARGSRPGPRRRSRAAPSSPRARAARAARRSSGRAARASKYLPEQQQRDDHGSRSRSRRAGRRRRRRTSRPSTCRAVGRAEEDQRDHRPQPTPRACRATRACPSWSRRGGGSRAWRGGTATPAHRIDRRRQHERDPLPAVELQPGHHRDQRGRARQHDRRPRDAAAGRAPRRPRGPPARRRAPSSRGRRPRPRTTRVR